MTKAQRLLWSAGALLLLATYHPVMSQNVESHGSAMAAHGKGNAVKSRHAILRDLPHITQQEAKAHPPKHHPLTGLSAEQFASLKQAAGDPRPGLTIAPPPANRIAPTVTLPDTPQPGISFAGRDETCSFLTPPDMALAAQGGFVVQVINACISVYDRNGNPLSGPTGLNTFLGLPSSAFTFDPRATYDPVSGNFIVIAAEYDNNTGTIWVAASQTPDPTAGWNIYGLPIPGGGTRFGDFPTLGQDRQLIYVCMNAFVGNTFVDNPCLFLPKAPIYSGLVFSYNFGFNFNVGGRLVDSIQPANIGNLADNPRAEFMINSFNINFNNCSPTTPCNGLVVWAVSNPLVATGSPGVEISGIVIPTANNYTFPPNAHQPGCSGGNCLIDTGDPRIGGMVKYGAGSIWGALTTGHSGNPGSTVLWFQVRPYLNDGNARCTGAFQFMCADISGADLLNEVCFLCGGRGVNGSNYYPDLQPDPEGNFTMVYNYSDDTTYLGTAYSSRRATQNKNTDFEDPGIFLMAGQSFFQQLDSAGLNRAGDYTAASLDLSNPAQPLMWFSGEYSTSGMWATQIGSNAFTAPNQP